MLNHSGHLLRKGIGIYLFESFAHSYWLFSFNHSLVWYAPRLVRGKLGQVPSNDAMSAGSITPIKPPRTEKRRASGDADPNSFNIT